MNLCHNSKQRIAKTEQFKLSHFHKNCYNIIIIISICIIRGMYTVDWKSHVSDFTKIMEMKQNNYLIPVTPRRRSGTPIDASTVKDCLLASVICDAQQ